MNDNSGRNTDANQSDIIDTDVLVLGGGAAGQAAAPR